MSQNFAISVNVKENGRKSPNWNIHADMHGEQTLADLLRFTKNALLTISSDVLREEQGRGFDQNPLRLVDGSHTKALQDVNPLGKIQYVARQNLREIIEYSFQAVWDRSPVLTGEYLKSNVVTYNGRQVANSPDTLKRWLESQSFRDNDKIRIVNTAPYARKLELEGVRSDSTRVKWGKPSKNSKGRPNGKGQVRKPNGAYTMATKSIKAKYGKAAFIKFELLLGSTIGLVGPGRVRKTGLDIGRPYVYPSILIYAFDTSATPSGGTLQ
jgi:hypothetical protein